MTFGMGPHLFLDDALMAESRGLRRTTHQPTRLPDPVLDHDRPSPYLTVLRDNARDRFRMWYGAMAPKHGFALAESRDGIAWTRPSLEALAENYLDLPLGWWGLSLIDDGPRDPEPDRRYKLAWYEERGMCVAFSPDGVRFQPHDANPVLPTTRPESPANVISDILDLTFDPLRREYLLGCKLMRTGYPGKPANAAEGQRRVVGLAVSTDFINWTTPVELVTPDPGNGMEEFYGFKPKVRGDLYIGFLRVLRDDRPATPGGPAQGIGWTELMSSRDGRTWTRYQAPFLDRHPREGEWDHAMAWFGDIVTVGDKDYVYYGGYRAGHKVRGQRGDRSVGLAILRKNGFVSRDAGPAGGFLKTPGAVLPGSRLTVNAAIRGELRVRLTGPDGKARRGFDWADGVPARGDSVAHPIAWREGARVPKGAVASLEFSLTDADFYGFEFAD